MAAQFVESAFLNIFRIDCDSGLLRRPLEALEPLLGIIEMQGPGDGRQATVPQLDEVPGGLVGPFLVPDCNGVTVPVERHAIDTYDRGSSFTISLCLRGQVTETGWNHDQAGGTIGAQLIEKKISLVWSLSVLHRIGR